MGRAKITDTRKNFGLSVELAERIKRYRFAREYGTEAEAIRALIERGLDAEGFGGDGSEGKPETSRGVAE